jgi:predicted dehydrogenase/nucleoside-diphosphate-sugar epimerase
MKIAVTGPTSFLGASFVTAARAAGHEVIAITRRRTAALDRDAARIVQRDMRAVTADDLDGADAVVHFATGSDGEAARIIEVAVNGTLAVLAAAREAAVRRLVHVSSMSVYPGPVRQDARRPGGLALEDHPERRGVYAQSKTMAETALYDVLAIKPPGEMEITVLRPGLVFGRDMKDSLAGTAVRLPLGLVAALGRPNQGVPFVDMNDLCTGLLALLETPPRTGTISVHDVLSGPPPGKRAVIAEYHRLTGHPCRTLWLPRWLLLPAAWALDGIFAVRRQPRYVAWKIDRMFGFDPADLPHDAFWRAAGREPAAAFSRSLETALTVDRRLAPSADAPALCKARAGALLDCAADRTPVDAARLVLLGAGGIVEEMHVPAIRGLPGVTVAAVVDPDPERAERIAREFSGARPAADIDALDDDALAGAVAVIATPGHSHVALGCRMLARGASVLVEKPVALDAAGLNALAAASAAAGLPVSVFKNYRLRPNTLRLWRFLASHDVGGLVSARVLFHAPRLATERARWMQEEKRFRVLPLEQAIHFVDIACIIGGPLTGLDHLWTSSNADGTSTLALQAAGRTALGATLELDFDLSGTATRTRVTLQFERCVCEVDFYPEGFRVLPVKATPIDDLGAALARLGSFTWSKLRPDENGVPRRVLPHLQIYRRHLRTLRRPETVNPFAPDGIGDTMRSLYLLCERAYGA